MKIVLAIKIKFTSSYSHPDEEQIAPRLGRCASLPAVCNEFGRQRLANPKLNQVPPQRAIDTQDDRGRTENNWPIWWTHLD